MTREVRVGVLASGRGTNFRALVEATRTQPSAARVVCLASDTPGAPVCDAAASLGLPFRVVPETAARGRLQPHHEQALCDFLEEHDVDLVCLAGFMRIIRGPLLQRFRHAILNIHPSLLPSFPGLDAPRQALEYGVRLTGCTVHFVDAGIDSGPILLQASVPVHDDDTVASLTARIQEREHRLYPQAVALWATGRVHVDERRVLLRDTTPQTVGKEETP